MVFTYSNYINAQLSKKMSVIATVPEEEEVMDHQFRYAIVGCRGSGKTAIAKGLKQIFKQTWSTASTQYLSCSIDDFKNHHGADVDLLRHVYADVDEEYWIKQIHDKINTMCDLIVVDDVRYKCEIQYLKEIGFKIVFVDTDWMIRLERIVQQQKASESGNIPVQQVKWFYDEAEIDMEKLPASFYDHKLSIKVSDTETQRVDKVKKLYEELLQK